MDRDKISLCTFRPEDQSAILEILTNNVVNRTYMLPDFEKPEDAIPLFNRLLSLSGDSERFVRCIAQGDQAVGFLNDVEIQDGSIEIGYVIHPRYHNRGFMTAALKTAIGELFQLGYREVVCGAFEENSASIRVMKKSGMKRMDKAEDIEYRSAIHHCIYYHIENKEET